MERKRTEREGKSEENERRKAIIQKSWEEKEDKRGEEKNESRWKGGKLDGKGKRRGNLKKNGDTRET